jgi:hypothetical protein
LTDTNFTHSTLRERIVEHAFVGDALRRLWQRGIVNVEVLRSEFDAHGFDLVMERCPIVRHIQLKTGTQNKPRAVSVPRALADKPSGCVLWIHITNDLAMGPFFWFGDLPGKPLPLIDEYAIPRRATHTKAGVRPSRQNHRLIPNRAFKKLQTIDDVLNALFGELRS